MSGSSAITPVHWVAAATVGVLAIGSVIRWRIQRHRSEEAAITHLRSLKTWWIIVVTVTAAILLGRTATIALVAVVSGLALREFAALSRRLSPAPEPLTAAAPRMNAEPFTVAERYLWGAAQGLSVLAYVAVWLGWSELVAGGLPVAAVIVFGSIRLLAGPPAGFAFSVARATWGLMLTAYGLAHAVLLFTPPAQAEAIAAAGGWFAFLLILTESNDIAQALVGRRFGSYKMIPWVSPGKSWEGFLGGVSATLLLAILLAPWLTTLGAVQAALGGVVIAVCGFLGDVNMSALKRNAGVKDSSQLLPGQGGMLDRVDSLTFSAPAFYYYVLVSEGFW